MCLETPGCTALDMDKGKTGCTLRGCAWDTSIGALPKTSLNLFGYKKYDGTGGTDGYYAKTGTH